MTTTRKPLPDILAAQPTAPAAPGYDLAAARTGKARLLDLFCGAGGAAKGYQNAGFYVVGVDIQAQPHYCGDEFHQADALEYLAEHGSEFDVIHASPPCQGYSNTQKIAGKDHPMLIEDVRAALVATGNPYIIENVRGAPLRDPVLLVGSMFGLGTMRPRLFECSFPIPFMLLPPAPARHAKMSRTAKPGEMVHVAGKGGTRGTAKQWADAMGIDWMGVRELAQAIPPAYTEWIGRRIVP